MKRSSGGSFVRTLLIGAWAVALPLSPLKGQDRGAARLDQAIRGLTVTTRVLMIGAHPDDENTRLIALLARGHRVETAYLSLTRGESGRNLIGNEIGDGLGAIRTAEVLAARRIDGGHQFFTRAYDFGFSKTADETNRHWPYDAVLNDVVLVVRAFRPHVIVSLFTGTPADSDGQHEVSAWLAREAYARAADTSDFPVAKFGLPWIPSKLYGPGTGLTIDAGGFDPVLGRTYADIAAESRALQRTQGVTDAGSAARLITLARIASRVNDSTPPSQEQSLFDGIDTSFARLAQDTPDAVGSAIRLVAAYADSARAAIDLRHPDAIVRYLALAARHAASARGRVPRCLHPDVDASTFASPPRACRPAALELDATLDVVKRRATEALLTAAGISIDATADRELIAYSDSIPVVLTVANHGRDSVQFVGAAFLGSEPVTIPRGVVRPDDVVRWTVSLRNIGSGAPWWLGTRLQDMYPDYKSSLDGLARPLGTGGVVTVPSVAIPEDIRRTTDVTVTLRIAGELVTTSAGPILFRSAEPLLGVQDRPVSGVPSVTLEFDHGLEWIPTGKPIDRLFRLTMKSFADSARTFSLRLHAPPGVRIDSLPKAITLQPHERREVLLHMGGALKAGRYEFGVIGSYESDVEFAEGLKTIQYPYLRPIRMSRGSALWLAAVDIVVPKQLNVAYLQGVGDAITPFLSQLGVRVTVMGTDDLLNADLSLFTTIVVGVRAYEAHPELIASNPKLLEFARRGGTLVVQYGTTATYSFGVFPYPLGVPPDGSVDRVTVEDAPVRVLDPASRLLTWPNRIGEGDWRGWVYERAAFMPSIIDPHYATPLEMHDPDDAEHKGAIVVARVGKGMYIYTTLALYRQLPGAVPGSARLIVNLLSAGLSPDARPKRAPGSVR